MVETVFGFWFIGAIVVAIIAASRDRHAFGWFVLAVLISPLLAGILVLALGSPKRAAAARAATPTPETHVKCPECREFVLRDARKCKHCGTALIPVAEAAPAAEVYRPPSKGAVGIGRWLGRLVGRLKR